LRQLNRLFSWCLATVMALFLLAMSTSGTVMGCSEIVPRFESLKHAVAYRYGMAENVVLANALSAKSDVYPNHTTFASIRVWKGDHEEKVVVVRGHTGPCGLADYQYKLGDQYLLYLIAAKKRWYWPWDNRYIALFQIEKDSIVKEAIELDRIVK